MRTYLDIKQALNDNEIMEVYDKISELERNKIAHLMEKLKTFGDVRSLSKYTKYELAARLYFRERKVELKRGLLSASIRLGEQEQKQKQKHGSGGGVNELGGFRVGVVCC
jgi:hypothetical protein